MILIRTPIVLGIAVLVMAGLSSPVAAGGSGGEDEAGDTPHVFGFVKDPDGSAIADARVNAVFKAGGAALITRSDATGAYRIPMFTDTDPAQMAITCSKDGYRFKEVLMRNPTVTPGASVEADCIIAHE
jgi:hypothetical protein